MEATVEGGQSGLREELMSGLIDRLCGIVDFYPVNRWDALNLYGTMAFWSGIVIIPALRLGNSPLFYPDFSARFGVVDYANWVFFLPALLWTIITFFSGYSRIVPILMVSQILGCLFGYLVYGFFLGFNVHGVSGWLFSAEGVSCGAALVLTWTAKRGRFNGVLVVFVTIMIILFMSSLGVNTPLTAWQMHLSTFVIGGLLGGFIAYLQRARDFQNQNSR